MIIENKFNIGQRIYLDTDPEQYERIITGILITQGDIIYRVVCGDVETYHFEFELSKEKKLIEEEE